MKYLKAILYYTWKLYIGVAFALTLLFFYPFLFVLLLHPRWKKHTFKVNILWSRVMRMLCFYAVEIVGEHTQPNRPHIICANHTSYLDIFLLYSAFPKHPFLFMGKAEILTYPLVKTFFKRLNIPVFRGDRIKAAKSFIRARKEMHEGWSIVIFPEGGIPDENPQVVPFKDGAFKLAQSARTGILPITFTTNYLLFSDPENYLGSARPGISIIKIHPFIDENTVQEMEASQLNEFVFDQISAPFR